VFDVLECTSLLPPPGARVVSDPALESAFAGLARSLSRSGKLLAACSQQLSATAITRLKSCPERAALYCVVDHCAVAHDQVLRYLEGGDWQSWAKAIGPKWGLQSANGLAGAALSILLGVEGGVHTFFHTTAACQHALAQAHLDLASGRIDLALVAAASSLEDPVASLRNFGARSGAQREGAGMLLLAKGTSRIDLADTPGGNPEEPFFGLAQPLLEWINKKI
jgi:hypothetical protein